MDLSDVDDRDILLVAERLNPREGHEGGGGRGGGGRVAGRARDVQQVCIGRSVSRVLRHLTLPPKLDALIAYTEYLVSSMLVLLNKPFVFLLLSIKTNIFAARPWSNFFNV